MNRNVFRRFCLTLAAFPAAVALLVSSSVALDRNTTAVADRLKADLKYLASDELEGRGVGTKGLGVAAGYIREQFKAAGLDVTKVKGDAYFAFKLPTGSKLGKNNTLTFTGKDGKTVELKYGKDFATCSFGRSGKFNTDVVFLGYGIHAPKLKYDDYKGVDIKGKVVIIMRRNPQQGNPHSPFRGGNARTYQSLRHKYTEAFTRGAAAVLFVNDPYYVKQETARRKKRLDAAKQNVTVARVQLDAAEKDEDEKKIAEGKKKLQEAQRQLKAVQNAVAGNVDELMTFGYGGNVYQGKDPRPIFHITQKAADRLLKAAGGKTLEQLAEAIDEKAEPKSAVLAGVKAKGEATLSIVQEDVKNVIGVLEGEGPLADETIVIGAHYDHVGRGKYGSRATSGQRNEVHNGADDNGSGTVALIELARRLGSREKKLPRRIVFIAFTAEELGLIGSRRYVDKPVYPLEKTVAMFNMDMVGRLRDGKVTVFAVGSSPRWEPLLKKHAGDAFKLSLRKDVFPRSDHASFVSKKIPAIHFFTNTHTDYHRPSDDWQKINYQGMAGIVDLIEAAVVETAETKERPKFVQPPQPKRSKTPSRRFPYFGTVPDYGATVKGIKITGTQKDSPAQKAGVKAGDVIVQLGKYKVIDIQTYAYALSQFKTGDTTDVYVMRDGKKVKLTATFTKRK